MTPRFFLLLFTIIAISFSIYSYKSYWETGGYETNSDSYYGYSFPRDNGFKKVEDCQRAITEFPDEGPPSKRWMEGCIKYFELNKH